MRIELDVGQPQGARPGRDAGAGNADHRNGTPPDSAADVAAAIDHADFTAAYLAYSAAIYAYVRRMVGNDAEAEDLTVVTFEKALRAWERHPLEGQLRPWLFRIATNTCLDELRRRRRIQWQPWTAVIELFHPSLVATDDPEREVLRRETAALVRDALAQLSSRDRAALVLREYHDLSVEEVGATLGISGNAAKVVLFRARERLRAAYLRLGGSLPGGAAATARPAEARTVGEPPPAVVPRRVDEAGVV
jgi:RNA polymerase sigma factor (sigma-70 family)